MTHFRALVLCRSAGVLLAVASCSVQQEARPEAPADVFFGALADHCGAAYEGVLASSPEAAGDDFAAARLVMHVHTCTDDEIRTAFHVGEDRSRTWVLTRTEDGLRLKHDHRHEDGVEDEISQYGGDTRGPGTADRQEFPVDDFSIDLFQRNDLERSTVNVWAMEITDAKFAYELRRKDFFFRVEFDVTAPIEAPTQK
ncbi:MAG: hypothetical protein AAGA09_06060 [Pseudomonadota bacterium]